MYQYSYLIGVSVLLLFWAGLFFWRKDVRKEMLILSFIFGVAGLINEWMSVIDWWHPLTITGTLIGPEDFLFGFAIGGIAAVIYEVIFKRKLRLRKVSSETKFRQNKVFFLIGSSLVIIFLASFYLFKLNSFYSSILAFFIPTIYIWIKRRDLILDSLTTGFILILVASLSFIIPELITPGWVQATWYLENWYGTLIFCMPLKDIIWFFFAGLFIGPLYEFWQEAKLAHK